MLSAVAALVAAPAGAAATDPPPASAKGVARETAKPTGVPANVTLAIDTPTTRGPWTMRVTNDGDVPVTLVADARLLMLDVTARGARSSEHCELPADMRPQDDLGRPLVLPPKRTYSERFEPRLYCLESRRLDALAPGSMVVAHLGWNGKAVRPPLEVAPLEGMESQITASKAITSLPVALPDEPTPAPAPRDLVEGRPVPRVEAVLALHAPRSIDASSVSDLAVALDLTNKGHRATIVRFRPETLAFDVLGPDGADHCGWSTLASAPNRDLFATLDPGAAIGLTVMLSAYCPTRVFEQAGFYVIRASLDTRRASGAEIGIRSFDGQVIAITPTVVRLRHGTRQESLVRPRLQPGAP